MTKLGGRSVGLQARAHGNVVFFGGGYRIYIYIHIYICIFIYTYIYIYMYHIYIYISDLLNRLPGRRKRLSQCFVPEAHVRPDDRASKMRVQSGCDLKAIQGAIDLFHAREMQALPVSPQSAQTRDHLPRLQGF